MANYFFDHLNNSTIFSPLTYNAAKKPSNIFPNGILYRGYSSGKERTTHARHRAVAPPYLPSAAQRCGALQGRCVSTTARQAADTLRDSKGFLRDNGPVISSDLLDFQEVFFNPLVKALEGSVKRAPHSLRLKT